MNKLVDATKIPATQIVKHVTLTISRPDFRPPAAAPKR